MAKKSFYKSNITPIEKFERESGEMLYEDKNAFANLPQRVIMKEYPSMPYANAGSLNDTMSGIDHQVRRDSRDRKKSPMDERY